MTNKTKAAIEEAAKLPTAEETLSQTYKSAGWRYDLSVLPTGCPHESLALNAIESHTAAHTAALREENTRYREALERIASEVNPFIKSHENMWRIVFEALKNNEG